MKVYKKNVTQSLADSLGQALVEHMKLSRLHPDFYHAELKPEGGFILNIICNSEKNNEPISGGMYKGLSGSTGEENRFEFEFTPLKKPLKHRGKEYNWLFSLNLGWLPSGSAAIIRTILGGNFAYDSMYCHTNCVLDPNAKPDDFYTNNGYIHQALEPNINIPVMVKLYNQKYNKSHTSLQDLLYSFWRDQWESSIEDIKSLTVNGYPLGNIIVDNTCGKFWALD